MISVVGISHQNAPIDVRERLAISTDEAPALLSELIERVPIEEALVVSTCNRVEVVVAADSPTVPQLTAACEQVKAVLVARSPEVKQHLYQHQGVDAVRHLFRVAASLDSLVVGEPQILGQVKDAFEIARAAGSLGSVLHRVVAQAIHAAKRVRNETAIGAGQISVPTVAVDLARHIFGDLSTCRVMLVGSGEMAETVAKLLRGLGAQISVVGRNRDRVEELAQKVDGVACGWHELKATLVEANVVITSTSAPHFVIDNELVQQTRRARRGRSLFCIDLAVPRDVDPAVEEIDGVFLYNIDDLSREVFDTLSSRQREAEQAERIVAEEAQGFERWAEAEQATPTIVALRERFRSALRVELERSLRSKLKHVSDSDREAMEKMLDAAVNKLLHLPTRRLRQGAVEKSLEGIPVQVLLSALTELFELSSVQNESPRPQRLRRVGSAPDSGASPESTPISTSPDAEVEEKPPDPLPKRSFSSGGR